MLFTKSILRFTNICKTEKRGILNFPYKPKPKAIMLFKSCGAVFLSYKLTFIESRTEEVRTTSVVGGVAPTYVTQNAIHGVYRVVVNTWKTNRMI